MASPWVEDDDETDWAVPDGGEGEASGSALPYVDPQVAAELPGEGPPASMGTRWREIEAEHQWEAWNTLRRWVDWFVAEYRLVTSVVPPCWYKRSDVTAELYAAMCMEYKVWEEQAPGLGPMMMWHPPVEMLTARLRRMVDEAGYAKIGAHKEPEVEGPKRRCGPLRPRQLDRDSSSRYPAGAMIWGSSGRHPLMGPTGAPGRTSTGGMREPWGSSSNNSPAGSANASTSFFASPTS